MAPPVKQSRHPVALSLDDPSVSALVRPPARRHTTATATPTPPSPVNEGPRGGRRALRRHTVDTGDLGDNESGEKAPGRLSQVFGGLQSLAVGVGTFARGAPHHLRPYSDPLTWRMTPCRHHRLAQPTGHGGGSASIRTGPPRGIGGEAGRKLGLPNGA